MTINTVSLDAVDVAAHAAGKDLFITTNRCRFRVADPFWSSNGRWDVVADISDADTPARWVADGAASRYFRTSGASGLTTAYLMFDLTALDSRLGQIDAVALCGQFSHLDGNINAFWEMSNHTDFSTSFIGPGGIDMTGLDGKGIRTQIGSNNGYRNVRYARWRITTDAASFGAELRVSESIAGTRVQLARNPRRPRHVFRQAASRSDFVSYTGDRQRVERWRGAEPVSLSLRLGPGILGLNDKDEMERFWPDCEQGGWPVVYCDDVGIGTGNNFSNGVLVDCVQDDFQIVQVGPHTHTAALELMERPPFRAIAGS